MRFFISLVECWWHGLSTQWKTANPENHINIITVQQLSNRYLHKVKKSFSRAAKLQLIAISLRESFLSAVHIGITSYTSRDVPTYLTRTNYLYIPWTLQLKIITSAATPKTFFTWFNAIFSQTHYTLGNQTTNESPAQAHCSLRTFYTLSTRTNSL